MAPFFVGLFIVRAPSRTVFSKSCMQIVLALLPVCCFRHLCLVAKRERQAWEEFGLLLSLSGRGRWGQ